MALPEEQYMKVLSRLQASCVKREYCSRDILAKAESAFAKSDISKQECSELAQRALKELVEDKFVSDLRYASAFAREKTSLTGWGGIKISYVLKTKGIDARTIKEVLAEVDDDSARERLERLLASKWKSLSEDPQGRLKLIKFALSRGYSYDEVEPLASKISKN